MGFNLLDKIANTKLLELFFFTYRSKQLCKSKAVL